MSFPLFLDANNLAKRAIMASATDDLQSGGTWTGGVYGSITSLCSLLHYLASQDSCPTAVVAVWDDGVPAFRMKAIPEYKAHRKERSAQMTEEQREKCFAQLPLIRHALELLGCVTVSRAGWEADDVLGAYALRMGLLGRPLLIASSDKDLWQCAQFPTCGVWDLGRKALVDDLSFAEHFATAYDCPPIPLAWYSVFRSIVGDASDNVKGVYGVGATRASSVINAVPGASNIVLLEDQIRALHTHLGPDSTRKWEQTLVTSLTHVRKMSQVNSICVPRKGLPSADFATAPSAQPLARTDFLRFCSNLSFRSILGDPDRYLQHFQKMAKLS